MEDKYKLVKMVMIERRFLDTRIMVGLLTISSFVTIFYNTISFSCGLSIFQNIIFTFIITTLTISRFGVADLRTRLKRGWWTACIVGAFPATSLIIISNIQYYLGDREIAYATQGDPVLPITASVLWAGLGSQLIAWLGLVVLSGMSGLFSAMFNSRWQFDD